MLENNLQKVIVTRDTKIQYPKPLCHRYKVSKGEIHLLRQVSEYACKEKLSIYYLIFLNSKINSVLGN